MARKAENKADESIKQYEQTYNTGNKYSLGGLGQWDLGAGQRLAPEYERKGKTEEFDPTDEYEASEEIDFDLTPAQKASRNIKKEENIQNKREAL